MPAHPGFRLTCNTIAMPPTALPRYDLSYRDQFWSTRAYEDRCDRLALRALLAGSGGVLLDLGAGFGRLVDEYRTFDAVTLLDPPPPRCPPRRERVGGSRARRHGRRGRPPPPAGPLKVVVGGRRARLLGENLPGASGERPGAATGRTADRRVPEPASSARFRPLPHRPAILVAGRRATARVPARAFRPSAGNDRGAPAFRWTRTRRSACRVALPIGPSQAPGPVRPAGGCRVAAPGSARPDRAQPVDLHPVDPIGSGYDRSEEDDTCGS